MNKATSVKADFDNFGTFELIAAFGEASDARLRGNAVHALAALNMSGVPPVAERAETELVRVLSQEPATGGGDWERRFAARALPAVRSLPEDTRSRVGDALHTKLADAADANQRSGIARLLLAANEPPERLWPLAWWSYCQLGWLAGCTSFWGRVWSGAWRSALIWYPAMVILAASSTIDTNSSVDLSLLSVAVVCIVAAISAPGRVRPMRRVVIADVAICAALVGLAGLLASLFSRGATSRSEVGAAFAGAVIGATVGGVLRGLRWAGLHWSLEPSGSSSAVRPVAAVILTTALVMAAAWLGADARSMVEVWQLLSPTALLIAWIDIWLLKLPPTPIEPPAVRGRFGWVLPIVGVAVGLVVLAIGTMNFKAAVAVEEAARAQQVTELPAVTAPTSAAAPRRDIRVDKLPVAVPVDVSTAGTYRFATTQPSNSAKWPRLILKDASGKTVGEDAGAPVRFTRDLAPGQYRVEFDDSPKKKGQPCPIGRCVWSPPAAGHRRRWCRRWTRRSRSNGRPSDVELRVTGLPVRHRKLGIANWELRSRIANR